MTISVLLADESYVVRKVILDLLTSDPEIEVVAESVGFAQTMRSILQSDHHLRGIWRVNWGPTSFKPRDLENFFLGRALQRLLSRRGFRRYLQFVVDSCYARHGGRDCLCTLFNFCASNLARQRDNAVRRVHTDIRQA